MAVALSVVFGGWSSSRAEVRPDGTPPVFVATVNGVIVPSNGARAATRTALKKGLSPVDVMNGIAFAKGALAEIIAGALDSGLSSEAILPMLLENGYPVESLSEVLAASREPASMVGLSSEPGDVEREKPLSPDAMVAFPENSSKYIADKDDVQSAYDRIIVEISGQTLTNGVRNLLKQGFDLCDVVKAAGARRANLRDVVLGAKAAGCPREMIARCAAVAGLNEEEVLLALGEAGLLGADYPLGIERTVGFSAPVPLRGGIGGPERAPFIGAAAP